MNSPEADGDAGHGVDAGPGDGLVAGARMRQLADEQAALRRVATLVASGARPADVFRAAAEEIRRLFGAGNAGIGRYEGAGSSLVVAASVGEDPLTLPVGTRVELLDYLPPAVVWRTGHSARIDDDGWGSMPDRVADDLRKQGVKSILTSPIIVEDRLWGVVTVLTRRGRFPSDTADRMTDFTELAATAIANAQAEQDLRQLTDIQAALQRLAMLVARGEPPEAVFAAVTREVLRHFGSGTARMIRYEADGTSTLVANEGTTGSGSS